MQFKAKIWRTGGSYVLTVPMAYVENGQLLAGKEYAVSVEDAEISEVVV